MTHVLKVEPAIPVELRHKIQNLLEKEGFTIHGAGTYLPAAGISDITFSKACSSAIYTSEEGHPHTKKKGEL